MKVKLTYFKENGKYYSEGTCDIPHQPLFKIWDIVAEMKELPGLNGRWTEGPILIDVPRHEHRHPHFVRAR